MEIKELFVQIKDKTKWSHINQQATAEMDMDLTKIAPGNPVNDRDDHGSATTDWGPTVRQELGLRLMGSVQNLMR